jgi:putative exosortase-associated protein (TIGR04073 family)
MKKIEKCGIIFVIIIVMLCAQSPCIAQNIVKKASRGVANIFTSFFEIPASIQEKLYDEGIIAAGTYGLFDGIYKCAVRAIAGVYEVATFPLPIPADYAPLVKPEFLFSPDEPYVH